MTTSVLRSGPWKFSPTPGKSTSCFAPTPSRISLPPIPERSSIPGVPSDPAETTTSFVPRTVSVSLGPSGLSRRFGEKATPVARFSLKVRFNEALPQKERVKCQLKYVLVECHILHVHAGDYVEVRACLFERVDHIVGYIRAKASLSVYPPARKVQQSAQPCMWA